MKIVERPWVILIVILAVAVSGCVTLARKDNPVPERVKISKVPFYERLDRVMANTGYRLSEIRQHGSERDYDADPETSRCLRQVRINHVKEFDQFRVLFVNTKPGEINEPRQCSKEWEKSYTISIFIEREFGLWSVIMN